MHNRLNIFLNSKINPNYVDFFISERNEIQEYIGELYAYSYLHFLRLKGKYPYSNEERSKLSRNIQNFGNLFDRLDFIFRRDEEFKLFEKKLSYNFLNNDCFGHIITSLNEVTLSNEKKRIHLLRCHINDIDYDEDIKSLKKTINCIFNNPGLVYELQIDNSENSYLFTGGKFLISNDYFKYSEILPYFLLLKPEDLFLIISNFEIFFSNKSHKNLNGTNDEIVISEVVNDFFDTFNKDDDETLKVISGNYANGKIVKTIKINESIVESQFNDFQAFHICKGIRDKHALYTKYLKNSISDEDIFIAHKTAMEALKKYGKDKINLLFSLPELPFKSDNFKRLFSTLDKRKNQNENQIVRLQIKNHKDEFEVYEVSFVVQDSLKKINEIRIRNTTKNIEIADISREGKVLPKENNIAGKNKNITPVLQFFYSITMSDENLKQAILSYGIATGNCSICGRELTNPLSKIKGIGPTCEQYI